MPSPARPGRTRPPRASALLALPLLWALSGTLTALTPAQLEAQDPAWQAMITVQPFPTPYVSVWERMPQIASLQVMYTGQESRDYEIEVLVRSPVRGDVGRALSPPLLVPFGPYAQMFTTADVASWQSLGHDSGLATIAFRSGVIPEGDYEICALVRDLDGPLLAEACEWFTIRLPEPPQLIFPVNEGVIPAFQPVFQWTPVLAPPEVGVSYRVTVVERLSQQTPGTALASNPIHFQGEVFGAPMLIYPPDALPLEEDRRYVWRVEALDGEGRRITTGGQTSEIWEFLPTEIGFPTTVASGIPDTLQIIPGVAMVHGLHSATVDETPFAFRLRGTATLELLAPFPASLQVHLEDLEVDKGSFLPPRFLGGSLRGELDPLQVPEPLRGPWAALNRLRFDPDEGLRIGGDLELPGLPGVTLAGWVQVTGAGLWGELSAEAGPGEHLVALGADPVRLVVRSVRIPFPEGTPYLDASVELMALDIGCDTGGRLTAAGRLEAHVACSPDRGLPLVPGLERARLDLNLVSGSVELDVASGPALAGYELAVAGGLRLDGPEGARCGASFDVLVSSEGGVALGPDSFHPRCDPGPGARARMDWLEARLSDLGVEEFGYTPGEGFHFLIRLAMEPDVPAIPGIRLPELVEIEIDHEGFRIPGLDVGVQHPVVSLAGFGFRLNQVRLPAFTLTWDDWEARSPDGFRFRFAAELTFPELPDIAPGCLAGTLLELEEVALEGGRLTATLPERAFSPACDLPLGGVVALALERLGGDLDVSLSPALELRELPSVEGRLVLPSFFQCQVEGDRNMDLGGTRLTMGPRGGISGTVTGLAPPCPLELPAVRVHVTSSTLDFAFGDGVQSLVLDGSATAEFSAASGPVSGSGSIVLDLPGARMIGGELDFEGPLRMDLPRDEPVLSFELASARLDTRGIHLDGRSDLVLPGDARIRTTFDQVVINPLELSLSEGQVLFDAPFGFEVGIGPDGKLAWGAVPRGQAPGIESGLRLDLPDEIALGPDGFSARGAGGAQLFFEGQDLDSLAADFRDQFAMALEPFGVGRGRVDLEYGGVTLGYIDRYGFHPNLAYFGTALLPARLGLPNVDIAYLELRDEEGELRVAAETTPEGIRLHTAPGVMLPLVIPALDLGDVVDEARVDVAFDLVLDPLGEGLVDGSFGVRIPEFQRPAFNFRDRGLPFAVDTLAYEADDDGRYRFVFGGRVALFGEERGQEASVLLEMDQMGSLSGALELALDDRIPLVPDSDRLVLALDTLRGWFDARLPERSLHFEVAAGGGFEFALEGGEPLVARATVVASHAGIHVTELEIPDADQVLGRFDLGPVRAGLDALRIPRLVYDPVTGEWDFELLLDLALEFAEAQGLELPAIRGVALRPDGFTIPGVEIPELQAEPFELAGFALRPLAFRMDSVQVSWFRPEPPRDWGFAFDLELSFPQLPSDAPVALRNTRLTILDAGFRGGRFTGAIEPRELEDPIVLRFGDRGLAYRIQEMAGTLEEIAGAQEITVTLGGTFDAPEFMRCEDPAGASYHFGLDWGEGGVGTGDGPNGEGDGPRALLTLSSAGSLAGEVTGFVPACPLNLGPLAIQAESSRLVFGADEDGPRVELDLDGSVRLPAPTAGDTLVVAGAIGVDLVAMRLTEGFIEITSPFRWSLPAEDPLFRFVVEEARLDAEGLRLTGGGALDFSAEAEAGIEGIGEAEAGAGAHVGVVFQDLTFSLPDLRVVSGTAGFTHGFELHAGITPDGRLSWRALAQGAGDDPSEPGPGDPDPAEPAPGEPAPEEPAPGADDPDRARLRVIVPETVEIRPGGLFLDGTAGASLAFGDQTFDQATVQFRDGFLLGFEPVAVDQGRADLLWDETLVAYVDRRGFWPGDVFGMLPIPARLGLPDEGVAYLRLRDDGDQVLIESEVTTDGLRLQTRGGGVELVVPALAGPGGTPPGASVQFDVLVNPVTFQFSSGAISATAIPGSPLFSLRDLGLPLDVIRLEYDTTAAGSYALRLDGQIELPASLGEVEVAFRDLLVSSEGLVGTVEVGSWRDEHDPDAEPVVTRELAGDLTLELLGARAELQGRSGSVELAGTLRSGLFGPGGAGADEPPPVFFTAMVDPEGFHATAHTDALPADGLPLGFATFRPEPVGDRPALGIRATAQELAMELSGVLRVPDLLDGFALTIAGLEVGTGGVHLPTVELSGEEDWQELDLFGARLALKDLLDQPGVALSYEDRVLTVTLSGELEFLGNTTTFSGLVIGSDGTLALEQASLISEPLVILQDVLTVDSLTIASNRLRADLGLTLPAPFDAPGPQQIHFSVSPAGEIEGGGRVVVLNESHGLGGDRTQFDLGVATLHPRYAALELDFANMTENSAVELVADVYLAGDERKRIQLGDVTGGTVMPGLRLGFDRSVTWSHFSIPDAFEFDYDVVRLTLREVSAASEDGVFAVGFSGELGIRLEAVEGALAFEGFRITSAGDIELDAAGITGSEFTIADVISIEVGGFAFSADPTTIEVQAGGMPDEDSGPSTGVETIEVSSFVRFGGRIDVMDVFAGGVEEFLFYRTPEDEVSLLVRGASLEIQDVLAFEADFRYRSTSTGFAMDLGAAGELLGQYSVGIVGMMSNGDQGLRAGMFLTVGAHIPIPPAIVLTEVGGGFFYNPLPEHMALVRQYAQVSPTATSRTQSSESDRFAVFLYGAASIISDAVAEGRLLVTLTDNYLSLDGGIELLNQGSRLQGEASLQVGLRQAYAEGSLAINVDYGAVVRGDAALEFFVYGQDAWGVMGNLDFRLAGAVDGGGELFIGPPGFFLGAHMAGGFDFWLISIESDFDASVWYARAASEWGAHAAIGVQVAVAGGLASVQGTLQGALITQSGRSPFLFAWAQLEAQVLGASWEQGVWAKLDNGRVSGGFGDDPALQAAIDRARGARDEMMAGRDEAQSTLAEVASQVASPDLIALTADELARGYARMRTASPTVFWILGALGYTNELNHAPQPGEEAYLSWYLNSVRADAAPGDTLAIREHGQVVESALTEIASLRDDVTSRMAAVRADIQEYQRRVAPPPPPNPVTRASFAQVRTQEAEDEEGRTVKILLDGPDFDVDAQAAASARSLLAEREAEAQAFGNEFVGRIEAVEAGLATIRAVTTSREAGSFLNYARLHARARVAAESQLAGQVNHILNRREWLRAQVDSLLAREAAYEAIVQSKTSALFGTEDLVELTENRLHVLEAWTGTGGLVQEYLDTVDEVGWSHSFVRTQANLTGRQLWFEMAGAGMIAADTAADSEYAELRMVAEERLERIRGAHREISRSLDRLFLAQADLTGALYDLYDRYRDWLVNAEGSEDFSDPLVAAAGSDNGWQNGDGADSGSGSGPAAGGARLSLEAVEARMAELRQELEVPVAEPATVHTRNEGYAAWVSFRWSGSHPRGVHEHLFEDVAGAGSPLADLVSNGTEGLLTSYVALPEPGVTEQERTFQHGVRGGAGYAGMGRSGYTVYFNEGGGGPGRMTLGSQIQDTSPPPAPTVGFPGIEPRTDGGEARAFSAELRYFEAEWSAHDTESGISAYEYALGTSPGGTELRDWDEVGGRTRIRVEPANLSPDRPIHVSVRARNGAGLWSPVGVSPALYPDTLAPRFPENARIHASPVVLGGDGDPDEPIWNGDSDFQYLGDFPLLAYEVCPVPDPAFPGGSTGFGDSTLESSTWSGSLIGDVSLESDEGTTETAMGPGEPPRAAFRRPDALAGPSGIRGYYWKVGRDPETHFVEGTWTFLEPDTREFTVDGDPLAYGENFHLSLVAVSYAGRVSEPLVHGPFTVADVTPPSEPVFCAGVDSSTRLQVIFSSPSTNPETGVEGYRYRVRLGTDVIRDWPSEGVDWPGTLGTGDAASTAPLTLTDGGRYFVDVLALNPDGIASEVRSSGSVLFDTSPPPQPSGGASWRAIAPTLFVVRVDAPDDPHSGIRAIQYAVGTGSHLHDVIPWSAVAVSEAGRHRLDLTISEPQSGHTYWVQLRTVNGAGLPSTTFRTSFTFP